MSEHRMDHDDWFDRMRSGASEYDEEAIPREIQDCVVCQSRLSELSKLAAGLQLDAELERAVLADARSHGLGSRGEVDAALTRAGALRVNAARRLRVRLAVSAAACILAFFLVRAFRTPDAASNSQKSEVPIVLGDAIPLLRPTGEGADFREFAWAYPLGNGETIELQIEDATPGAENAARLTFTIESGSTWRPDDATRDRLPKLLRWRVRVFDAQGSGSARSDWQAASR